MKRCPQCGARFTDNNSFCLDDGAVLISESGLADQVLINDAETPTRFRSTTPANVSNRREISPAWMFVVIGLLVAALAGTVGYIFLTSSKTLETPQRIGSDNLPAAVSNAGPSLPAMGNRENVTNDNAASPSQSPTPIDIDGKWLVTYSYKDGGGGYFDMRLKREGGKLSVSTYDYFGSSAGEWYQRRSSLNGNIISFGVGEKQGYSTVYSGKIANGTMRGTILTKNQETGKTTSNGTWTAKRK